MNQEQRERLTEAISAKIRTRSGAHLRRLLTIRGRLKCRMGATREAIPDFTEALRLDPLNARVLFLRALAHRELHRWDLALVDLSAAIASDSKSLSLFFERGVTYLGLCKFDEALSDFLKCIASPDLSRHVWFDIGEVHLYGKNQPALAIECFRKYISDWPTYEALFELGIAYYCLQDYQSAYTIFSQRPWGKVTAGRDDG